MRQTTQRPQFVLLLALTPWQWLRQSELNESGSLRPQRNASAKKLINRQRCSNDRRVLKWY
jgi:hypothetical protein